MINKDEKIFNDEEIFSADAVKKIADCLRSVVSMDNGSPVVKKSDIEKKIGEIAKLVAADLDSSDGKADGIISRETIERKIRNFCEHPSVKDKFSGKAGDLIGLFEKDGIPFSKDFGRADVEAYLRERIKKISNTAFDVLDVDTDGIISAPEWGAGISKLSGINRRSK